MTTKTTTLFFKNAVAAFFSIGLFLFATSTASAQILTEKEQQTDEVLVQTVSKESRKSSDVYIAVEKRPDFPGGMQAFYDFIGKNYKTPDVKGLNGKIFIQFVIEVDGSLTDIKSLRDIGHGTGEEGIRVLKLCPKWIPGEDQGKKVRVQYSLPIAIRN